MAVESLLLTAKVGHLSEDFGRRGAFSGVSNLNFSVTKFSLGTLRSHEVIQYITPGIQGLQVVLHNSTSMVING